MQVKVFGYIKKGCLFLVKKHKKHKTKPRGKEVIKFTLFLFVSTGDRFKYLA